MQSQNKLLEFMQIWGFAISFATCQPANKCEYYIHGGGDTQRAAGLQPKASAQRYGTIDATSVFWATVYKKVRTMLSDHCPVCLSVLSVCNVGVLWLNGWMDQDETWHGLCPGHTVLDGDPCLLWPNGRPSQLLLSTCFTYWLPDRTKWDDRLAHSLANWDSCPSPAKNDAVEYLQVGPTEIRYSIAWTIFVYL